MAKGTAKGTVLDNSIARSFGFTLKGDPTRVRIARIARMDLVTKDSRVAVLHDGQTLPVSRSGHEPLRELLGYPPALSAGRIGNRTGAVSSSYVRASRQYASNEQDYHRIASIELSRTVPVPRR